MCGAEKKTETVRVHMGESLFNMIARLAAADDRSASEYCERVLKLHVFGHAATLQQAEEKGQGQ